MADSSDFVWDTEREETFRDLWVFSEYDVREARRIIVESPRSVKEWATEKYREIFEDALESTKLKDNVDWSTVNDDIPIIVVREPRGGTIIDGHHRLQKRMTRGAATVPVVILTEEETARIRLSQSK